MTDEKLNIWQILNKISEEAGALAPEKTSGIPFAFRGISQVLDHLSPLLKKYGVVVVPGVRDRVTTQREVGSKTITQSDLLVDYTFYAPDGTHVVATTNGLAQDFADRSAAQAQSVAFRVALLQVFKLPNTDIEPEALGEEVQAAIASEKAKPASTAPAQNAAGAVPKAVTDLKDEISALFKGRGVTDPAEIRKQADAYFNGRPGWDTAAPALKKLRDALKNGEDLSSDD